MMKKFTILNRVFLMLVIVTSIVSCKKDDGGEEPSKLSNGYKFLKEVTTEKKISRADIIAELDETFPGLGISTSPLVAFIQDVNVAAITYKTTGVDGKPIIASGVVAMVSGTKEYDHLLSIQHGTIDMEKAPTHQLFYYEMAPVMRGHIVVMADYLGYGVSQTADRQHPYLHNESTGRVCADMIEAAREYLASKHIKEIADKVELIGYSQGANSTMATVYEMEKRGQGSRISAVHAGGGAYDLTSTMISFLSGGENYYDRMGYIPYIVRGLSYGDQVTLDDTKIYSAEIIEKGCINMFNTEPISKWHSFLGREISKVIHSDFFAFPTFNGNKDILTLFGLVEKNSLVKRAAPQAAVKLYHSKTDDFVPYINATSAINKWDNAELIDLSSEGHGPAGVEFMFRYMGLWGMIKP